MVEWIREEENCGDFQDGTRVLSARPGRRCVEDTPAMAPWGRSSSYNWAISVTYQNSGITCTPKAPKAPQQIDIPWKIVPNKPVHEI